MLVRVSGCSGPSTFSLSFSSRDDINLKVFCRYEALKMDDTIGRIVESESAKLAAYDNCSINADHRNMTKFTDRTDTGYGQVRGLLVRWIQD